MNIRCDYLNAIAYTKDIGVEKITAIQNAARIVYAKPCPFCGGEPQLYLVHFPAPGCGIECSRCHIKTLYVTEGTMLFPGPRTPENILDCLDEVLKTWNRRCSEDPASEPQNECNGSQRLRDIWKGMDE